MNKYIVIIILILLTSCASKKNITNTKVVETPNNKINTEDIIAKHYANFKDFKTLYIKSEIDYKDENREQSVSAEIKIKKNETILISIRLLGFTVAKALITPSEVQYYEKINGKYFRGNFTTLSNWLGTDLDFEKIQNMLIGKSIEDLNIGKYKFVFENNLYKIEAVATSETLKKFYIDPNTFSLTKQEATQEAKNRSLQIIYPNYSDFNGRLMPVLIQIMANQSDKKVKVNIQYKSISVDEELTFPYNVPNGYQKIDLKQ